VTGREVDARATFLNRLLGDADCWPTVHALLVDLCDVFSLKSAGVRWPAEGPAVLVVETGAMARSASQVRFNVAGLTAGSLWADGGVGYDEAFIRLLAHAIGTSATLRQALGPVADQARIAQRLEDAGRVAVWLARPTEHC
jgi:hypothetical protein